MKRLLLLSIVALIATPAQAWTPKKDGAYTTVSGRPYKVENHVFHGLGCGKKYGHHNPKQRECQSRVLAGGRP